MKLVLKPGCGDRRSFLGRQFVAGEPQDVDVPEGVEIPSFFELVTPKAKPAPTKSREAKE